MTDSRRDRIVAAFDRELAQSPVPYGLRSQAVHDALHSRNAHVGQDAAGARKPRRGTVRNHVDSGAQRQSWAPALVAALLAVAIVVTLLFTARDLGSHTAPARTPPVPASAYCSASVVLGTLGDEEPRGFLHMMTATVGWRGGPARTTDGGVSWQSVQPPALADAAVGVKASCFLDADHAWITQSTGPSPNLVVFRTADGGQTWQQGVPIPVGGIVASAWLAFIDDQHGWLFTGSQPHSCPSPCQDATNREMRTIYATTDGGLHWSQVVSASDTDHSVFGTLAVGCVETGMTFITTDTGWLTWDCYTHYPSSELFQDFAKIAVTRDGGRTWHPVALQSNPSAMQSSCGARPPVFSGNQGVLSVGCRGGGPGGAPWNAVFTTNDSGHSWNFHHMPFVDTIFEGDCCPEDFVNGSVGWAFPPSGTGNDLYMTTNGGHDWVLVKQGLFSGQRVDAFQFLSGGIGFVYTYDMRRQGAPWKTTDGGQTWSKP